MREVVVMSSALPNPPLLPTWECLIHKNDEAAWESESGAGAGLHSALLG
jgi:hypothetical protein